MDLELLALGAAPPLLAIVAELATVVSRDALASGVEDLAKTIVRDAGQPEEEREREVAAAVGAIVATAEGSVQLAAVVPTWIGVTAGALGAAIKIYPLEWCLAVALLWTALTGIVGTRLLQRVDPHALARDAPRSVRMLTRLTKAECLSWLLITLNAAVIAFVVAVAWASGGGPATGSATLPIGAPGNEIHPEGAVSRALEVGSGQT